MLGYIEVTMKVKYPVLNLKNYDGATNLEEAMEIDKETAEDIGTEQFLALAAETLVEDSDDDVSITWECTEA